MTNRRPLLGTSLKDVAQRAGVSIKTVSNVINDFPFVSAATRAKVQVALDELDYRPNLSARSLRGGRTGVVALAVPEISSPYFAELAAQFVQQAKGHGWTETVKFRNPTTDKIQTRVNYIERVGDVAVGSGVFKD